MAEGGDDDRPGPLRSRDIDNEKLIVDEDDKSPLEGGCAKHDLPYFHYCLLCKEPLCPECLAKDIKHDNHKQAAVKRIDLVRKVRENLKEKLKFLEKVKSVREEFRKKIIEVNNVICNVNEKEKSAKDEIDDAVKALKEEVNQAVESLIESLEKIGKEYKEMVQNKRKEKDRGIQCILDKLDENAKTLDLTIDKLEEQKEAFHSIDDQENFCQAATEEARELEETKRLRAPNIPKDHIDTLQDISLDDIVENNSNTTFHQKLIRARQELYIREPARWERCRESIDISKTERPKSIVVSSSDGTIAITSLNLKNPIEVFSDDGTHQRTLTKLPSNPLTISSKGEYVVPLNEKGEIGVYSNEDDNLTRTLVTDMNVISVAMDSEDRLICGGISDKTYVIQIYSNLQPDTDVQSHEFLEKPIMICPVLVGKEKPDRLAVSFQNKTRTTLAIVDPESGRRIQDIEPPMSHLLDLDWDPRYICCTKDGKHLYVCNWSTRTPNATILSYKNHDNKYMVFQGVISRMDSRPDGIALSNDDTKLFVLLAKNMKNRKIAVFEKRQTI